MGVKIVPELLVELSNERSHIFDCFDQGFRTVFRHGLHEFFEFVNDRLETLFRGLP